MILKIGGMTVKIRQIPGALGVSEVLHYGLMTAAACEAFRHAARPYFSSARAGVIRLDTAIHAMDRPPSLRGSGLNRSGPPGVIVIGRGQSMALWQQHSQNLAEIGVIRAIFWSDEMQEAYGYAAALADLPRLAPCRPSMSDSGFAALGAS